MSPHDPIETAIELLGRGEVVVLPTDTVYGLAVAPHDPRAIEALFELKGRPRSRAIPILAADVEQLKEVAVFDSVARAVAARFWPGPLTLVLPRAKGFDIDLGGTGRATVAVRIPKSETALILMRSTGPLAVTSANLSGAPPATTSDEARATFGERVACVLEGGKCNGEVSTIISLVGGPEVLREGPLGAKEVLQTVTS
ncbi:MAG: L-threonylcarbamoyladenylate synthase [Actinomycetota bacterium]|nr:L-threonylcarbamoyladenylate synthase [Actinomycetota bacterium]